MFILIKSRTQVGISLECKSVTGSLSTDNFVKQTVSSTQYNKHVSTFCNYILSSVSQTNKAYLTFSFGPNKTVSFHFRMQTFIVKQDILCFCFSESLRENGLEAQGPSVFETQTSNPPLPPPTNLSHGGHVSRWTY